MAVRPPENSTISVATNGREQLVSIPYPRPPATTYMAGVFILFWLGGWAFGEISAAHQIMTTPAGGGTGFLVFWLCAWTVGGLFAVLTIRRVFQRSIPETIKLELAGLVYDPGIAPFKMPNSRSFPAGSSLFPKRTELRIDRTQLKSLRLREGDTCNRLTVDAGAQRIELASGATDVEREWLFKLLSDRYLPAASK
ncbi:hypothetical protein FJ938_16230 [Mesorhizobium sp. B2-4-14]|uniref:hypothetical protein n=1 Tax=Mesorhizobium sp. B2-4-14 TaxID=2589935 RepID=UPI00112AF50F|nr:hypothetical protein [Mesorhizobium sp. B2-4-14]TPL04885.1 hypothetical protein FJ938_16230 [Mesorhizobium sp. B2-4-14]